MKDNIKDLFVKQSNTISEAMQVIEDAPKTTKIAGIAVVVDETNHLIGVVTDGDIRSAILSGTSLDTPISSIMTKNPIKITVGLQNEEMYTEIMSIVKNNKKILDISSGKIIVVDKDNIVVDVVSFLELIEKTDIRYKTISVIGMGYVGLTLALVLADSGFKVYGIDSNKEITDSLNKGVPHFFEVGLESLLKINLKNGQFTAKESIEDIETDIFIVAVGTPIDGTKNPNMSYITKASEQIGAKLKNNDLIILRSTVPVGTTRNTVIPILEEKSKLKVGRDFHVSFAPERTIEGKAIEECRTLPQIIGGYNEQSESNTVELFNKITPMIVNVPDLETAEMIKLSNNCFRDLSFAFSNELALLCNKLNVDVNEVIHAANHGYVRNPIPIPSPGVGGSCLTKDPYIFTSIARRFDIERTLPLSGREINEEMIRHSASQISGFLQKNNLPLDSKIFILGIAFKGEPETSDLRFSTTVDIFDELKKVCPNIYGYDPVIEAAELKKIGMEYQSIADGIKGASVIMVMNNHYSLRKLPLSEIFENMKKPGLFYDPWSLYSKTEFQSIEGIKYGNLSI